MRERPDVKPIVTSIVSAVGAAAKAIHQIDGRSNADERARSVRRAATTECPHAGESVTNERLDSSAGRHNTDVNPIVTSIVSAAGATTESRHRIDGCLNADARARSVRRAASTECP